MRLFISIIPTTEGGYWKAFEKRKKERAEWRESY